MTDAHHPSQKHQDHNDHAADWDTTEGRAYRKFLRQLKEKCFWRHNKELQTKRSQQQKLLLNRRTMLRSASAAVMLPRLPSLVWAENGGGIAGNAAVTSGPPRRWLLYMATNGVAPESWGAEMVQEKLQLKESCKPLERHADDLLFIDGMRLFEKDNSFKPHEPYFSNFLSGKLWKPGSTSLAQSIDCYMGSTVGTNTAIPHLCLGTEQDGTATTVSWSSATTPVQSEIYPGQAFDRLFDVKGLLEDQSIFDGMLAQTKRVRGQLDSADKHKLDEFTTSVREIEQRIARAINDERAPGAWRPNITEPDMERPETDPPSRHDEHIEIMIDLALLAFRMDKTRICSIVSEADVGGMTYEFLDGVDKTGVHSLSHSTNGDAKYDQYRRVVTYRSGIVAKMLDKMKAWDEGGSSLMDNTMTMYGNSMRHGNGHDWKDLPLIIAGGKNCNIDTGRVVRVEKEDEQYLCNLHVAMAQRMGCKLDQWGNSTQVFQGLTR